MMTMQIPPDPGKPKPPGASARHGRAACHCFALRRLARTVSRLYDQHLAAAGLKTTQFSLLRMLSEAPSTLTHLAERLGLERTTLSRNVRPLIARGLVQVESGSDTRVRILRISTEGRAALNEAYRGWRAAQKEFEATLGAALSAALFEKTEEARQILEPLLEPHSRRMRAGR